MWARLGSGGFFLRSRVVYGRLDFRVDVLDHLEDLLLRGLHLLHLLLEDVLFLLDDFFFLLDLCSVSLFLGSHDLYHLFGRLGWSAQ